MMKTEKGAGVTIKIKKSNDREAGLLKMVLILGCELQEERIVWGKKLGPFIPE